MPAGEHRVHIEPARRWVPLRLADVWEHRELLYFLVWRDLKVRYKQTALGAAWAIVQPVITVLIFTVVFGMIARLPAEGFPYPVFVFAAVLPWNYFALALHRITNSVVGESHLISKIYFPRLVIPLSAVVAGCVDLSIGLVVLVGMMLWYGIVPTWAALTLPLFLVLAAATALAVGLWLSALNAKYRDIGHAIPFLIQSWMFASPVAYSASAVPPEWRTLYSLNPMVGVIEGFRWGLLGSDHGSFAVIAGSAAAVAVLLVTGLVFFKSMEATFADVV